MTRTIEDLLDALAEAKVATEKWRAKCADFVRVADSTAQMVWTERARIAKVKAIVARNPMSPMTNSYDYRIGQLHAFEEVRAALGEQPSDIHDLIERSSLGTSRAKAIRDSVSVEEGEEMVRRSKEVMQQGQVAQTWAWDDGHKPSGSLASEPIVLLEDSTSVVLLYKPERVVVFVLKSADGPQIGVPFRDWVKIDSQLRKVVLA